MHGDAVGMQRALERRVAGDGGRFVAPVPVDGIGSAGTDQRPQYRQAVTAGYMQLAPLRRQLLLQGRQGMVQPPSARGTGRPRSLFLWGMHVHRQYALVLAAGRNERGMISQAQVASEQDQCRAHLRMMPVALTSCSRSGCWARRTSLLY